MNYLDILIAIPLLWGFYRGFTKGLILQLAGMISFVLGIYAAILFSDAAAAKLKVWLNWQTPYLPLIAFVATFLAVLIGILLLGKIISTAMNETPIGWANKLSGAVLGSIKYLLLISVILFIVDKVTWLDKKTKEKSLLYRPVSRVAPILYPALNKLVDMAGNNRKKS